MNPVIASKRIGFTNVYLIEQNGKCMLIDAGSRGEVEKIRTFIHSRGYALNDLSHLFVTHTHYDHAGSAADLVKITGAKIIVHKSEASCLEKGFKSIPKGTSLIFKLISKSGKLKSSIERRIGEYPSADADIQFNQSLSLIEFGFDAEIIHTPGHTEGSSCLILGNNAIVGDCMFNLNGNLYPGFADNEEELKASWRKLLNLEIKWFYPAHGKRFNKEELMQAAKKKKII